MTRRPEPRPWGFAAHVWQAWTFVLASLLMLTNAAWFYTVRVARAEAAASAPKPEPRRVERVIYQTADRHRASPPAARPGPPLRDADTTRPLASDERCIDGIKFRISGDAWTTTGPC